jgi:hypothetical protein
MYYNKTKFKNQKKIQNKIHQFIWTPSNILILAVFLVTAPFFTYTTLSVVFSTFTPYLLTSVDTDHHSTSIPWIENKYDCEKTGRIWQNNKCWDNEHNPMF